MTKPYCSNKKSRVDILLPVFYISLKFQISVELQSKIKLNRVPRFPYVMGKW